MGLKKCPHCELNYIQEGEKYCNICRRALKGEKDHEEYAGICLECGESAAVKGSELCAACLRERLRQTKHEILREKERVEDLMLDDRLDDMEEIEVPIVVGIPQSELVEIDRELGMDDEEENELEFEDDTQDEDD